MAAQLMHLLLLDDEPAICKALSLALTRAGYRVSTSMSGDHGINIVKKERVDAMIIDLRIPDMRGDTFFELASAIQPHLRSRSLFTTGDITERAQELIEACNCPMLRKPFDLKDLIDWVRRTQSKAADSSA
jgi:two-component system response regulator GlrR